MPNSELSKLKGLDWLVAARNHIQSFMLDLSKEAPLVQSGETAPAADRLRKWNLFLGAAFSLWRAVFLIDGEDAERKTGELAQRARDFLDKVIKTNAISFPDEYRERNWAAGYYLNNARYRMQLTGSISNAILKDVWNDTFDALQSAFDTFKANR